jgi:hypothetical protein
VNRKIQPIRDPTLFEMDKLDKAADLMNSLNVERPHSEPGLFLGTSAFTAAGWQGSFYPPGMQPREYLSHYAKTFRTVEVDSTFSTSKAFLMGSGPVAAHIKRWTR